MYTLDFDTMKQVMQAHRKTGLLTADVPAGFMGIKEPGRIEIVFEAGTMIGCTIVGVSGWRITSKDAITQIARIGQLFWNFVPQAKPEQGEPLSAQTPSGPLPQVRIQRPPISGMTPTTQPLSSSQQGLPMTPGPQNLIPARNFAGDMLLIPRRAIASDQGQTRSWPRIHRQIFALADGTRNSGKIAEMLSIAPEQVAKALHELQAIGAITLGSQNGRGF